MPNIYVEQQKDGSYKATRNGQTIATGNRQQQAIDRARTASPEAKVLVERVRDTKVGGRDKWRRGY